VPYRLKKVEIKRKEKGIFALKSRPARQNERAITLSVTH